MQRAFMTLLAAGLTCIATQHALAEGGDCDCPVQAALQKLPVLEFVVGSRTTSCAKTAAKLAKDHGSPIKYIVRQAYQSESAATLALAERTEAMVKQFTTPNVCKLSGETAIGGKSYTCSQKVSATAKVIKQAIDAVPVSYKVGNKSCNCPIEAKSLSAKSKAEVVYVADGTETRCPIQHRLNTGRARYRAAVAAVAKVKKD